jgi:hypothetical protein
VDNMLTKIELIGCVIGLAVVAALIGWGITTVHHRGYVAGQNEREAYYAPLLKAAHDAKDAADARADRAEKAAGEINAQSEKDHALFAQTLRDRVDTANARMAAVMRERSAADRAARRCQVPAVAGSADQPAGAAASDERDRRFSNSVSDVGRRCEHDAMEVAEFQAWYARQRANAAQVSAPQ